MKKIGSERVEKNLQQNIDPNELVAPDSEQPNRAPPIAHSSFVECFSKYKIHRSAENQKHFP